MDVSTSSPFNNSSHWHSRSDVEWSVHFKAEIFVHSLGYYILDLVSIDDLPSLVGTVVSIPCDDLSSFLISSTMDIKALSVLDIDEVLIFISEDLPPS
jgi:hypothetical protein